MDVIEGGARTAIRPYADSDDTIAIRWFKCAPGAKVFPHRHAFAAMYFEGDYNQDFQGPGLFNRDFENVKPTNPGYPGTHFEGDPRWFLHGIPPEKRYGIPAICADASTLPLLGLGLSDGDPTMFSGASVAVSGFVAPSGAAVDVEWDAVEFDTNGYFTPGLPTLLSPLIEGYYLIGANLSFGPTSPAIRQVNVLITSDDGLDTVYLSTMPLVSSIHQYTVAGSKIFKTDKPFKVNFQQENASSANKVINGFFWIVFLGPVLPPPPPQPLLIDAFNDADGTPLTDHTMDLGPGWNVSGAAWTIESNAAEITAGASAFAWADAGASDVTITTTVAIDGTNGTGIVGRLSDVNNLWVYYYGNLYERNAGVYTVRASGGNPNVGDSLSMECTGTNIAVKINGVTVCSYGSATFNQTATNHGLCGDSGTSAYEDFEVTG